MSGKERNFVLVMEGRLLTSQNNPNFNNKTIRKMNKKIVFAALMTITLALTSCGSTATTAGTALAALAGQATQSEAYTSGQAAGTALRALYSQYKTNGKLDMTNLTTLTNVLTLTNSCQLLKSATKGSGTYSDFSKGLVAGSSNLINTTNTETVMDNLTNVITNIDTTSLTNAVNKGNTAVNNAVEKGSAALENAAEKGNSLVENANSIASSVSSIFSLFK